MASKKKLMGQVKAGFIEILLLILPLIMPLLLKLLEWLKSNPQMTARQRTKYQSTHDTIMAIAELGYEKHGMVANRTEVNRMKRG